MYGILSLLYVLEYYESIEDFEECQKIIDAVKEQEHRLNIKLFTKINNENIKSIINEYKHFNLTKEKIIDNSKYYATLILNDNPPI